MSSAKDLISACLRPLPETRPTLRQVRSRPPPSAPFTFPCFQVATHPALE